jgi:hypothetical protein
MFLSALSIFLSNVWHRFLVFDRERDARGEREGYIYIYIYASQSSVPVLFLSINKFSLLQQR